MATKPDQTTAEDDRDQTTTVVEGLAEVDVLTRQVGRHQTGIAVPLPTEPRFPDVELLADEIHELDTIREEIASRFTKRETAVRKEPSVHERDLSMANALLAVVAPITGAIPVSLETHAGNRHHLLDFLHRSPGGWTDTDSHDTTLSFHEPSDRPMDSDPKITARQTKTRANSLVFLW